MGIVGMREAGERIGVKPNAARVALLNAGVPLITISARSFAVDEDELAAFIAKRPEGYKGRGRPAGVKNKPK